MESVKRFIGSASPLAKMLMAVSITSALVVGHRWFYKPYAIKKRYEQAEEWAEVILEEEERLKESGEPYIHVEYPKSPNKET